jgi:hypothetical protein
LDFLQPVRVLHYRMAAEPPVQREYASRIFGSAWKKPHSILALANLVWGMLAFEQ